MTRTIASACLVAALLSLPLAAVPAESPRARAGDTTGSRDGWPDTPAGAMGRRWVDAFSAGEESMREFNRTWLAKESLAERGIEQRTESYRRMRGRFGKLVLAGVVKSAKYELSVRLLASEGSTQVFTFRVRPKPPHQLVSVGLLEHRGHGFGGVHGH